MAVFFAASLAIQDKSSLFRTSNQLGNVFPVLYETAGPICVLGSPKEAAAI